MFRGGRVESKGDLKVIDQMGIANLAKGGRVGYQDGNSVLDIYESINKQIPMPERPEKRGMSTSDYLRIASAGLNILGAPSEGSGIGGALRSAAPSLSKLGTDLGSSFESRETADEAAYQNLVDKRNEKLIGLTGAQAEMDIGELKAQGDFGRRLVAFDAIYETKKEGVTNDSTLSPQEKTDKLAEIEIVYNNDKEYYLIKGGDVSDFFKLGSQSESIKAAGKAADRALKAKNGSKYKQDVNYSAEKAKLQAQFLAIMTQEFGKQFAEGGPVTEDVNMMTATPSGMTDVNVQETMQTPETQLPEITYDELRARLPAEIGDEIVTLLASSREALATFAEIRTQTDVDSFNQQFQVQLVLPQEA